MCGLEAPVCHTQTLEAEALTSLLNIHQARNHITLLDVHLRADKLVDIALR
jgi:hypothetical protein